ncbi:MAG: hypothetical protein ACYC7E_22235 [Armatimonadota bacterium]
MQRINEFIEAFGLPMVVISAGCALAALVWLGVLGQWGVLIGGVAGLFLSSLLLSVLLFPARLLRMPMGVYLPWGGLWSLYAFGVPANLYLIAVMTCWCCGCFFLLERAADDITLAPRLLWAYVLAITPWAYQASQERDEHYMPTALFTVAAIFGCTALLVLAGWSWWAGWPRVAAFVAPLLAALLLHTLAAPRSVAEALQQEANAPANPEEDAEAEALVDEVLGKET